MKFDLITHLKKRTASAAIGASTARRMGPKGTVKQARQFLTEIDLSSFRVYSQKSFIKVLDRHTNDFISHMPKGAKYWGSCRKFLNIYLRDVLYNQYLNRHFKLQVLEAWLEVPLDSHIAEGLRATTHGKLLPRWRSVIGLDRDTSESFQAVARDVAAAMKTDPVHLDVVFWRSNNG